MRLLAAALAFATITACGGEERTTGRSPSPSPKDYLKVASSFRRVMQAELDKRSGEGVISLAFVQVIDQRQYGKVLLVHVGSIDTSRISALQAGVDLLLGMATVAGVFRSDLGDIAYGGVRDPTGGEFRNKIDDLIAFADKRITEEDLKRRTIFDAEESPEPSPEPPGPSPTPARPRFRTFGDGQHVVGEDIRPGTYRTREPSTGCYWARLKGFSGELDDIAANENTNFPTIVTIYATDKGFESNDCGEWTSDLSAITSSRTRFDDGVFIVGTDMRAGTYRSTPQDGCYWARLSGFSGELRHTIANDNTDAQAVVRIRSTDKGFESSGCGPWRPIG
jgi:hypothetical protein